MTLAEPQAVMLLTRIHASKHEHHGIKLIRMAKKSDTVKNKKLVLVVDDDAGIQNLTRDILELYGHSVLVVGSRDEALNLCERRGKEISVVLLDVMKSETAAFDVFRRITEINPGVNVIISGVGSQVEDGRGLFGQGSTTFLKKPYRMTELLRMVESHPSIH